MKTIQLVLIFCLFFVLLVQSKKHRQIDIYYDDDSDQFFGKDQITKFQGAGTIKNLITGRRLGHLQYRQNAMNDNNIGRFTAGGSIQNKRTTHKTMTQAFIARGKFKANCFCSQRLISIFFFLFLLSSRNSFEWKRIDWDKTSTFQASYWPACWTATGFGRHEIDAFWQVYRFWRLKDLTFEKNGKNIGNVIITFVTLTQLYFIMIVSVVR